MALPKVFDPIVRKLNYLYTIEVPVSQTVLPTTITSDRFVVWDSAQEIELPVTETIYYPATNMLKLTIGESTIYPKNYIISSLGLANKDLTSADFNLYAGIFEELVCPLNEVSLQRVHYLLNGSRIYDLSEKKNVSIVARIVNSSGDNCDFLTLIVTSSTGKEVARQIISVARNSSVDAIINLGEYVFGDGETVTVEILK